MRSCVRIKDPTLAAPVPQRVSDDEIRETLEDQPAPAADANAAPTSRCFRRAPRRWRITSATRRSRSRGRGPATISIKRVVDLYPDNFVGVCQLPQSPGVPIAHSIAELTRCVNELGFVGCNLNPDPSGGHWTAPPLTDRHWYPLYEKMVELDVPAMVHVSASCNPNFHATGAHYINADTTAFMQFIQATCSATSRRCASSSRMAAAPCRITGDATAGSRDMLKRPPLDGHVMRNVFFDTCVYHQPGIDLLVKVIDIDNILFGSEMVGAVRGIDPQTGHYFDDTKRYIDALARSARRATARRSSSERASRVSAARRAVEGEGPMTGSGTPRFRADRAG